MGYLLPGPPKVGEIIVCWAVVMGLGLLLYVLLGLR